MAANGRPRQFGTPTQYADGLSITPDDGTDLVSPCVGISVLVAGNVSVDFIDGETAVIVFCLAGANPYAVKRIRATGTTATGIVALY